MRVVYQLLIIVLYITTTATDSSNLFSSISSFFKNIGDVPQALLQSERRSRNSFKDPAKPEVRSLKTNKKEILQYDLETEKPEAPKFSIDPILNYLRRTPHPINKKLPSRRSIQTDSSESSSSSLELKEWKDEWKNLWLGKKLEAMNMTTPKGDFVNMVAARPWGVSCGDPNVHDMPWGTCMLPMECDPEFRIFRGDNFCGRSQFVCCALQLSAYDMYQGFDASFADSSLSSDSNERKHRDEGSGEKRKRKRKRDKKKRERNRLKRKRRIQRNIKRIVKEIQKILNRVYTNGTTDKKRKTKQLKKFIKNLKKKYKSERLHVKGIHETELDKIDDDLLNKFNQILGVHKNFISNSTFRDIVVNGSVTKDGLKMMLKTYPELFKLLRSRRAGGGEVEDGPDHGLEYGYVYY